MRPVLLSCVLLAVAPPALSDPAKYVLDPEHTLVAFTVSHMGYADIFVRFTDVTGGFVYDDETQELSDVRVSVPTVSVESHSERRDGHIRGTDFLDAEANPDIVFTADGGTPTSENTGTVEGMLTVRGQTLPLVLDVTLNRIAPYPFLHRKETLGASATGTILRSDYGMTYALEGGIVGDEVSVIIELEAIRED